ncbi:hypothetical protein MSG66_15340 [Acinetobacter sp. IK31]|uniref:hypothetical protein n=1 Tax=Acinetobacter sp. IK31 TaxID=2928895 RepID=UPI002D21263F|nr:hypothetical protein [Acinetobacter sp. IK31]MEB3865376.1 hypothetical protein [Acinetobacter sp. IK31]
MPFLGEKKAQQSHKDCAWHISSFIVDAIFLSRNDLKPENPKDHQAAKYNLRCVVIAFGKECQEIKNVQSQLLFIWSSARH